MSAPAAVSRPQRRLALLPVVAAVALATLALRLPEMAVAVSRYLPEANTAKASETATPAAPPAAAPATAPASAPAPAAAFDPDKLTPSEIDVLQNLARRRAELDARVRELDSREALLAATEARIDRKLAEIKEAEARIAAANASQTAEEDAQISRLVKVYESMKPTDAANIFNSLDFPVLIEVASRMKELKIAPVLAAMDPQAAKALTVALARRRGAEPAAPAPGNGG